MQEGIWKKGIVLGIVGVFLGASTALGMHPAALISQLPGVVSHEVPALVKHIGGRPGSVGNVKVSLGAGNDSKPRMTTNAAGDIIIVYEQENEMASKTVPVVYSTDGGDTWMQQFEFNSLVFQGSGLLTDPDIIYNPEKDLLWIDATDPNAEMYNEELYFISGDIVNATNATGYACSASTDDYYETACTHTNDYFISFTSRGYNEYRPRVLGIGWFCYPDFVSPPGIAGYYSDYESLIRISPVAELEADYNGNRWFLVAESEAIEGGTQICIKSGTTNKALIESGEQQNGMDKYGDIEIAPGEFLGVGTDPDVSGSGSNLAVVFVRNDTILCSVSSCVATYEPEFNWTTTTVDTGGASTPAVYIQGNTISVAYVKNGNLYYRVSEDKGATWGDVQQKNDINGTVVAEKGSVDVCKLGIAFVDNRNGNSDIYFVEAKRPAPEIVISITGGIGIQVVIKNIGDAPAINISWSITTEGFVIIGKETTGNISLLYPGDEVTIKTGFMVGFGLVTVTVNADTAVRSQQFHLFLIFMRTV